MGVNITAGTFLKSIYNGYAKKQFPKAPLLPDNGVTTMPDARSFLIQAADVIGNFTMAHTFVKLGRTSKSKEAKAVLIDDVFHNLIDASDWSSNVTLVGNDLALAPGAASIKFQMGWMKKAESKESS